MFLAKIVWSVYNKGMTSYWEPDTNIFHSQFRIIFVLFLQYSKSLCAHNNAI
jgi:hypothetical protein